MQILKYREDTLVTIATTKGQELTEVRRIYDKSKLLEMTIYAVIDYEEPISGRINKDAIYISEHILDEFFDYTKGLSVFSEATVRKNYKAYNREED